MPNVLLAHQKAQRTTRSKDVTTLCFYKHKRQSIESLVLPLAEQLLSQLGNAQQAILALY